MRCSNCQSELPALATICEFCGTPVPEETIQAPAVVGTVSSTGATTVAVESGPTLVFQVVQVGIKKLKTSWDMVCTFNAGKLMALVGMSDAGTDERDAVVADFDLNPVAHFGLPFKFVSRRNAEIVYDPATTGFAIRALVERKDENDWHGRVIVDRRGNPAGAQGLEEVVELTFGEALVPIRDGDVIQFGTVTCKVIIRPVIIAAP